MIVKWYSPAMVTIEGTQVPKSAENSEENEIKRTHLVIKP